jgi:hypothetical protein
MDLVVEIIYTRCKEKEISYLANQYVIDKAI